MTAFEKIRQEYHVPAKRGMQCLYALNVWYPPKKEIVLCRILSTDGRILKLRQLDQPHVGRIIYAHPTDENMEYKEEPRIVGINAPEGRAQTWDQRLREPSK